MSAPTLEHHNSRSDGMMQSTRSIERPLSPRPLERSYFDRDETSEHKTPTRSTFAPLAHEGQYPPAQAMVGSQTSPSQDSGYSARDDGLGRTDSLRSVQSTQSQDNGEDGGDDGDDQAGSDRDSAGSDADRPSKKKKGQRFFCTDYPPCQLSFTRSEHLARHIRKHTGERPFQCHCLRRFSRLDNLRQHAQTVHVNEEIPGDSLAATGTRFQRQIRTDRMRPPGARPRSSTLGSQGGHSRGHSRNYSGSSIGSVASEMGTPDDRRRHPPPLAMAQSSPSRASVGSDPFNPGSAGPDSYYSYYSQSPSGYTTPTSMFPGEPSSPTVQHGLLSPISLTPRAATWGARTHARRLSVPSGHSPYHSTVAYSPAHHQYMSPLTSSGQTPYQTQPVIPPSPTGSVFSHSPYESEAAAETKRKRQTWHPESYTSRPATSGLSYYRTPDAPQPVATQQPAATQAVRLPGIDSFDRAHALPSAPPRRLPSPMDIDDPNTQTAVVVGNGHRDSWSSVDHNLSQLDIASNIAAEGHGPGPAVVSEISRQIRRKPVPHSLQEEEQPAGSDDPVTPRKKKRQAWYNGPVGNTVETQRQQPVHRTSPEGSRSSSDGVPTPSTTSIAEYHPAILHSNGYVESHPPGLPPPEDVHKTSPAAHRDSPTPMTSFSTNSGIPQPRTEGLEARTHNEMNRLDALVAVATSEEQAINRT